ncbi:hypothetical protein LINGRAHAP2_LOCUS7121, partial [Linum grandiflorum]
NGLCRKVRFFGISALLIRGGGGGRVSFWNDFWARGVRLSSVLPRIAASAQSRDFLLFSCVGFDGRISFDFLLQFQLRGGVLQELHEFNYYLENLSTSTITMGPARVVWPLQVSSSFTVSSLMAAIRRQAFPGLVDFPYQCIWRKEVPTKIQGFMWLVFHNRILTMENLQRRCSQKVWNMFSSILSISSLMHHFMKDVITGWKSMNCSDEFKDVRSVLLHAFCWHVSLERNNRVIRDVERFELQLAYRIS